jgi:hypothetical protein
MTIYDAVECLKNKGLLVTAIRNETHIYGGTALVPLGDITGVLDAFGIFQTQNGWTVVIPDLDKTVYRSSLAEAIQTVIDLVTPLLSKR